MEQACFTSIVDVNPAEEDSLRLTLEEIDEQVRHGQLTAADGAVMPFEDITNLHYARFVLLGGTSARREDAYPLQLALSTDFDGSRDAHLEELCRVAGAGLDRVYAHCSGYTGESSDTRRRYLESHHVAPHAFYVGTRQRTREQIREEAELRSNVVQFMTRRQQDDPQWPRGELGDARREIETFVKTLPAPRSSLERPLQRRLMFRAALAIGAAAVVLLFVKMPSLLAIVGIPLTLLVLTLRYKEKRDVAFHGSGDITISPEERAQIGEASRHEDFELQNQLTHLVEIKPGIVRQILVRVVLRVIHLLARNVFYKGTLGGIPSIHFARWMIINHGERLLFFSNFDGSWQNYLGDFIDKAAVGLTSIWSNTRLYPRTRWLFGNGARDEERFKAWARIHQIDTQVWYAATPGLSVENVNHNTALRRMLEEPGATPDGEWLRMWDARRET